MTCFVGARHFNDTVNGISTQAMKKWLIFPVKNGAKKHRCEIKHNGELAGSFEIEITDDQHADWYAYLDISAWQGEDLEVYIDQLPPGSKALSMIRQVDYEYDRARLYREPGRGQIHFSPKRGWNNDPNGLVYYNGLYHLFFQHNPYGINWGNMHWGHATSKDLVHWTEIGEALYPDSSGTIFSGSGVVDIKNTSGLGTADQPAPAIFCYTYDHSWTQGLAYTLDGKTFTKLPQAVLGKISSGNRDPKITWYEPGQCWVMVLYVEEPDKHHTIHFYTSKNLLDWTFASKIAGGIDSDHYLYECPDFYELPVDGDPNNKKWVLSGANAEYAIGTFDGKKFQPEYSRLKSVQSHGYYAAQTFSNDPKGRKIEIGWWQTNTGQGKSHFNQSMSLPMSLELRQTLEGPRLRRSPVVELETLRKKHYDFPGINIEPGKAYEVPVASRPGDALEIIADFQQQSPASKIQLNIRGIALQYDPVKQLLKVGDREAHLKLQEQAPLKLHIYVDRTGLEIFANDGLFYMPVNINLDMQEEKISLESPGKFSTVNLQVYELANCYFPQAG